MPIKILLDTDIGSDIDDSVCLAYLLANPECDLLGITTVTGEATKRAQMASALCNVAGKDIPIYPGAETPFLIEQHQKTAQQAVALERWEHQEHFQNGKAIDFLRETIHSNPGEIILLTIGPLTNIALLFTMDPEIPKLLKGLVMMAGVFTNQRSGVGPLEWNAMLDPHATAVVYHHPVKIHRSIGLDVTTQVTMEAHIVREKFQTPLLKPVLDFAEVWFKTADQITFHDPLAAVTLFDDQVCQFEQGNVEVELTSSRLSGMTLWSSALQGNHEVALKVNPDRFFEAYFSVFNSVISKNK
jgi:purine nucleosidase